MARRTTKVGSAGRFGSRYGVRVRKRIKDLEDMKKGPHECPTCHHEGVKRVSNGVWKCRRCGLKFAAAAYSPKATRKVKRLEDIE